MVQEFLTATTISVGTSYDLSRWSSRPSDQQRLLQQTRGHRSTGGMI